MLLTMMTLLHRCLYTPVSRGVELLDAEGDTINSQPNKILLHALVFPRNNSDAFDLRLLRTFQHEEYYSNSWMTKLATNGRYIAAPTCNGLVFLFDIFSGQVAAILSGHKEIEVRDALFHPTKPLLFSSADDGGIQVYRQS
ncbi:hypothetical protein BC829DRAFT_255474 [Chytridium lagenaria]|nr:hypothetical protein BC829DRAFT_255474 [Chytridium lagenaria]